MSIAGLLFLRVYNPVKIMLQKYNLFVKIKFFFLTFLNFITKRCLFYFARY